MSKQKLMEVLYPVWVWCRRKSYLVSSVDTCEFELMNFTWYHCRFITAKGKYYQMNFYIPLRKRPSGISISWLASRRKRHWVGLFSTEFFFLVVLRGGRPYIVIGMIAARGGYSIYPWVGRCSAALIPWPCLRQISLIFLPCLRQNSDFWYPV